MSKKIPPGKHLEPERTRARLATAFGNLSTDRRFKPAERKEFARLSEVWGKTLRRT